MLCINIWNIIYTRLEIHFLYRKRPPEMILGGSLIREKRRCGQLDASPTLSRLKSDTL